MTNNIENEGKEDDSQLLDTQEISEADDKKAKSEKIPTPIIQQYKRPSAFQKSTHLGRGNTQSNNRQRPGRTSGRGR